LGLEQGKPVTENKIYVSDASASAFHWYQQADTKAQVLLGFSGVFLSIIVASLLSIQSEHAIITKPYIVYIVGGVTSAHLVAVVLSVWALWSRGIWLDRTKGIEFFGRIANYDDAGEFSKAVESVCEDQILKKKMASIYKLSVNTRRKHRLVDLAAIVSCIALFGTVFAAIHILQGIRPGTPL
jgi:hypothetical protein